MEDKEVVVLNIGSEEKPHNIWMTKEFYDRETRYYALIQKITDAEMWYNIKLSDEQKERMYKEAGFEYVKPDLSPRGNTYWIITDRGLMRKSRVDGSVYEVDDSYEPLLTPYTGPYTYIRDARPMDL